MSRELGRVELEHAAALKKLDEDDDGTGVFAAGSGRWPRSDNPTKIALATRAMQFKRANRAMSDEDCNFAAVGELIGN